MSLLGIYVPYPQIHWEWVPYQVPGNEAEKRLR